MKRKSISPRLRFEIFKRDSFTCQYCGKKSPDVLLHVDHVKPVSKGGTNSILNLITSCVNCNMGKSDKELSDNTALEKTRNQLLELQERKQQIELMLEWQKELTNLDDKLIDALEEKICSNYENTWLNELGRKLLKKAMKSYGFETVNKSIDIGIDKYLSEGDFKFVFNKIMTICKYQDDPIKKDMFYIAKVIKNRFMYYNYKQYTILFSKYHQLGGDLEELKNESKTARNWTIFKDFLEDKIFQMENK